MCCILSWVVHWEKTDPIAVQEIAQYICLKEHVGTENKSVLIMSPEHTK